MTGSFYVILQAFLNLVHPFFKENKMEEEMRQT